MRTWNGSEPKTCNVCGCQIIETFVDGFAKCLGQWAMMCRSCHRTHGMGLGTGKGQRFVYLHGIWIDERDKPPVTISADELKRLLTLNRNYDHIPRSGGSAESVNDTMDI